MSYRALIFDFDGTIADTLNESMTIFNQLADEMGLRPVKEEEIKALRELGVSQLMRQLGIPKRKIPLILSRGRALLREKMEQLSLIKGMGDVLPKLRTQCPCLGILTSNAAENVDRFLRVHNLQNDFTFVSSCSKLTGKAKYLRAISKTFSLDPSQMLYIGDELRDLKAARKAGTDCVAVTWGLNTESSLAAAHPDFLVREPGELLEIMAPSPV